MVFSLIRNDVGETTFERICLRFIKTRLSLTENTFIEESVLQTHSSFIFPDVIMDDDAANAHILFPGYPGRGVGFLDNEIDLSEEDTRHEFLTTPCYHDHCNNNRSNSAPNDEQEDSDIFNPRTENFDLGSVEDFGEFKSGWSSTSSHIGSTSGSPFGTASRSHKLDGDGFSDNFEIDWPATWSSDASDCDICVIDVCLELKYLETLFGFSVLGGCDEDNRPVIEHIDAGKL